MGYESSPGDRLRGSNAKAQAVQGLFIFSGEKKGPQRIDHEKERVYGDTVDSFGFRVEDVAHAGDPRWGLRLVHVELAELEAFDHEREAGSPKAVRAAERAAAQTERERGEDDAVRRAVAERPGTPWRELVKRVQALARCGPDRAEVAVARVAPALDVRDGPRRARLHYSPKHGECTSRD